MTFEITINADIQEFAQNACAPKWIVQHRSNEKAKRLGRKAWRDAGSPTSDRQVSISVVVRRARAIDELNIPGACKHFLDGFCCSLKRSKDRSTGRIASQRIASMIPDDNAKWARWGTFTQQIHKQYKGREQIVFIVEPIGPAMIWDQATQENAQWQDATEANKHSANRRTRSTSRRASGNSRSELEPLGSA